MNDLITRIKHNTFIFNDIQINNKIQQLKDSTKHDIQYYDVIFELYKDKQYLSKEEYITEITQYLYNNCFDSKDKIDSVIEEYKFLCDEQYDEAVNDKKIYYHAIQYCQNQLSGFLRLKPVKRENHETIDNIIFDD